MTDKVCLNISYGHDDTESPALPISPISFYHVHEKANTTLKLLYRQARLTGPESKLQSYRPLQSR
jgi:hypothetical protein